MTPEIRARQQIDQRLEEAGWIIQDMKQLDLSAGFGLIVREYPTDTGPADYVLFVNRQAVGVIEAKKDSAGENLTVTETQTQRYATANLKWRKDDTPLRFLFEATGQIIRFTDNSDPAPRSREIFHFFTPEILAAWLARPETLRRHAAGRSQGAQPPARRLAAGNHRGTAMIFDLDTLFPEGLSDETITAIAELLNELASQWESRHFYRIRSYQTRQQLDLFDADQPRRLKGSD